MVNSFKELEKHLQNKGLIYSDQQQVVTKFNVPHEYWLIRIFILGLIAQLLIIFYW